MTPGRGTAILLFLLLAALPVDAGASENRGTFAKPVDRSPPFYPAAQSRDGRQGWVKLSYVVTEDGAVVDPVVLESSDPAFEEPALKATRKWRYEPATWDGQPVQQCDNEVLVSFVLGDGGSALVSRPFYRQYKKIKSALDDHDLDKAKMLIEEAADDVRTAPEIARLDILRSTYAELEGNRAKRRKYLRRTTIGSGKYLDRDTYESVRLVLLVMQLQDGEYSAALENWEEVRHFDIPPDTRAPIEAAITDIEAAVAGPEVLVVPAAMEPGPDCGPCQLQWDYRLLRKRFRFDEATGNLDKVELRCDWHRYAEDFSTEKVWTVPDSWGQCRVFVFGARDAQFSLLELPADGV